MATATPTLSRERLDEFMLMTKSDQKQAKSQWSRQKQAEKAKVKASIPGDPCNCCQPRTRSDKGRKRGANAAGRRNKESSKRKSRRLAGEGAQNESEVNAAAADSSDQTITANGINIVSLGHDIDRSSSATNAPRYKKQGKLEYSRKVQMQGGEAALATMHRAMKWTVRAATRATVEPTGVTNDGKQTFDQHKPRHRIVTICLNEIADTPLNGSTVPVDNIRRNPPLLSITSR